MQKLVLLFMCIFYTCSLYADSNDPCSNMLNVVNSPSNLNSPCTVSFKKLMIELNYIDQRLYGDYGIQQNYPNAEVRFGLPANNEFSINLPNYIQQKSYPGSGYSSTFLAFKHAIYYNEQWMFALEELVNPPGGSFAYGSHGWGSTFNAIFNYTVNDSWSIAGMVGLSRLSDSSLLGGHHFNSIDPDIVLSYSINDKLMAYSEIYGQSKISALGNAGYNFDAGLLFLLFPNTTINISAGQQIYNYLGGYQNYINFGIDAMLDPF